MKVALLYNQKPASNGAQAGATDTYSEWDCAETIEAVAAALRQRHELILLDCHPARLAEVITVLQREQPDLCFNIAEGIGAQSREAQIPAVLDMLGLRYTASDVLTLVIALDKARTKQVLICHEIPTPAFQVIHHHHELAAFLAGNPVFPLIVKPLHEGSSKGIFERSVVTSVAELERQVGEVLAHYRQPALVETFLPGREFTVALLGNGEQVEVLPIVEIVFDHLPPGSKGIYSHEAKWIWDTSEQPVETIRCPASLPPGLQAEMENVARRTYQALRCRDWARIDLRLDAHGRAQVLEINPLPGILPDPKDHSSFPLAARVSGLSFDQLINRVLDEAMRRYGLPGCDGTGNPVA